MNDKFFKDSDWESVDVDMDAVIKNTPKNTPEHDALVEEIKRRVSHGDLRGRIYHGKITKYLGKEDDENS